MCSTAASACSSSTAAAAAPSPVADVVTRRRATVWTIRNGLIVRVDFNVPYDEALVEAGLS